MTVEEIRTSVPMADVLSRYGIKIKRGMCSCPFHGRDRHESMKVYKDGVHCFTCGFNSDQIGFVREYEKCDFKTAFYSLGGTYEHHADEKSARMAREALERSKRKREREQENEAKFKKELDFALMCCSLADEIYEPYSDGWCYLKNAEPFLFCAFEEKYLEKGEVNEIDVFRKCQQIRRRVLTIG